MTESSPDIWAGLASQYVGAWGQAVPMVQMTAIVAIVIVIAIIAWAWTRKMEAKHLEGAGSGVPIEAFAHVVEEQARQTEALRSAVEGLSEIVHEIRKILEARTICPWPEPHCAALVDKAEG